MNPLRAVSVHAALLVLGGAAAAFAWSKDKTPHSAQETNVTVWNVRPNDVTRIVHETKARKIQLEARDEKKGERWYLGRMEFLPQPGANPAVPPPKPSVFVSVAAAQKVVEAFAPFKPLRAIGKVPDSRAAEFGFDKKEPTVTFTIGGKERKLLVGGIAPGAGDSYVLDPGTNEAYVLKTDPLRDLEGGEMRLLEREQHTFKDIDVASAKVTAAGKSRQLSRGGPENKKFWSDPADKEKADETVGNWMQKVANLRVNEFAEKLPEGKTVVLRIDYDGASGNLGYIELVKTPPSEGSTVKAEYWISTEHTHLPGKLLPSAGEQVEQDLGSILK
jgi:hypothetical protein